MTLKELSSGEWKSIFRAKWPTRKTLALARLYRELSAAAEDYERARRNVVSRYVVCDETGEPIVDENGVATILPGEQSELQKALAELDAQPLEITTRIQISEKDIPDDVSPAELALILDYFDLTE